MRLRFLVMLPLLAVAVPAPAASCKETARSEEHTSELQSQ